MSSIKAILRKKANKEGLFPIAIRITKNRKSSYLYIGQYIDLKYWDDTHKRVKKSHPNANRLNHLILSKLSEANNKLIEIQNKDKKASVSSIKEQMLLLEKGSNFFDMAEIHLNHLRDRGKYNQLKSEQGRFAIFKTFLGSDSISYEDITVNLLKRFQAYLLSVRKTSPRTGINYMIVIRTVYNMAIREGLVEQKFYPFGRGKIQIKFPESQKIGLNEEEVKILENLDLQNPVQAHTLNVWLFSFYFAGIRIGDVIQLKWSDFIDDRLHYRMNKNQKLVTLKIPEKAKKILFEYKKIKRTDDDFIFAEMRNANMNDPQDVTLKTKTATRKFNKHLKEIAKIAGLAKNLSCHIARHTFGNISGNSISVQILQKLYRHSNITTTINYQANFIHKDFDDALDSVVEF